MRAFNRKFRPFDMFALANRGGAPSIAVTLTLTGNATIAEGGTYTLNIAASGDDLGGVTGYTVDWGDGSGVEAASLGDNTHTYPDGPLSASIVVTALHPNGNKTASKSVAVGNVAPTATITGDSTATVDVAYTATISSVTDQGDDTVSTYRIYWGDGSSDDYASAGAKTHTYTSAGTGLTVRLDLIDEDGTHTNVDNYALDVSATVTPIHALDLTTAPSASNAFDDYGLALPRTVTDYNGRIVEIPANAVPMGGLRPVQNLHTTSDVTDAAWSKINVSVALSVESPPTGLSTLVYEIDGTGSWALREQEAVTGGTTSVESLWVKRKGGADQSFRLQCGSATSANITATSAWQRVSFENFMSAAGTGSFGITRDTGFSTASLYICALMRQDISRRSDLSTAPDEYVSTDDDYGTGVNGFRYFDTELANTVASNVVTEGTGVSIAGWLDYQTGDTNLIIESADFTSATWIKNDVSAAVGTTIAPDGTLANVVSTISAPPNSSRIRIGFIPATSGQTYCFSVYLRDESMTQNVSLRLQAPGGAVDVVQNFTLTSDWQRLYVTATLDASFASVYLYLNPNGDAGTRNLADSVSVWGAQLETGTVPTAYIPTSGGSASRPAMSPAPTISGANMGETDLTTNGDFSSPTGWTVPTEVQITGGQYVATSVTAQRDTTQAVGFTIGARYRLLVSVAANARSGIAPGIRFAGVWTSLTTTGDYNVIVTATADSDLVIRALSGQTSLIIDSVTITEVNKDARLVVKGLAADLVTPDPTDTTERTLDIDNTDGEFDMLPSPIKVLSIDVYNDGERPD